MIRNYFSLLWKIISRPTVFFRTLGADPTSFSLSFALSFAIITRWLGASMGFIWTQFIGDVTALFESSIPSGMPVLLPPMFKERMAEWFLGVGPVILDPFLTLLSLLFTSLIIFAGARILITPGEDHPEKISYETVLKVLCFGTAPAIFAALPLFGAPLARFCTLIATVIGFKTVYRIGTGRALMVFLFPNLLFIGIIGVGLFAIAALVLQFL